ncbi:MAG: TIGR02588 family protein [Nodosilinea sp.]
MDSPNASPSNPKSPIDPLGAEVAQRSTAEWVTFLVAASILLGLVSLIVYDWQVNQNRPPAFAVHVSEAVRVTDGRYYVPFVITNTGGRIAHGVQVTAELHVADADDETGEQHLEFLSGHEQKEGSFVFIHNPDAGELVVRVASYRLP